MIEKINRDILMDMLEEVKYDPICNGISEPFIDGFNEETRKVHDRDGILCSTADAILINTVYLLIDLDYMWNFDKNGFVKFHKNILLANSYLYKLWHYLCAVVEVIFKLGINDDYPFHLYYNPDTDFEIKYTDIPNLLIEWIRVISKSI